MASSWQRKKEKTITDADYADDIVILANTLNQAETLLHSLERATAVIGLHVNTHKTEYMCYNQTGARVVIVIAVGNEHGDTSSNPGRDSLHFT